MERFVERYSSKALIRCIRASRHLMDQSDFKQANKDFLECAKMAMGDSGAEIPVGLIDETRWPSKDTLVRGRIRLDVASMLARREYYPKFGQAFRFVAFDASPQNPGVEMFASSERVVRLDHMLRNPACNIWPSEFEHRRLPAATLGQGRASLSDKVSAHCHQVWLEYGPHLRSVQSANADVRGVISDMGVESGIGDYVDVLDRMYGGQDEVCPQMGGG